MTTAKGQVVTRKRGAGERKKKKKIEITITITKKHLHGKDAEWRVEGKKKHLKRENKIPTL